MGKSYMGVTRSTFIIDPTGKIAYAYPKVSDASTHPAEVERTLEELQAASPR